jgi:hypothetical protein
MCGPPKPHDESRFEYQSACITPDRVRPGQKLREADEKAVAQLRKKLPGALGDWTLDYILVTGNPVDPDVPPLTHTFVFKKPRRDVRA